MTPPSVLLGSLLLLPLLIISTINAQVSSCGKSCRTLDDCAGQLNCIDGKCNDDPDVGTHICGGTCRQSGTLRCRGKSYPTYRCSPPVTGAATRAILTNNDFSEGGDGGDPSECDERYHSNSERIVALSTGWYDGGRRCNRMIRITARNGRSTTAKVVDECDSMHGCDKEHAYQRPCGNNVVDGSDAVWNALGLNIDDGEVPVTWTMAGISDEQQVLLSTSSFIDHTM